MASAYEQERAANIARNKAVMVALGLEDADVRLHAKRAPTKRVRDSDTELRRSKRLAGESIAPDAPSSAEPRSVGRQMRASVVGTASYEHTLHRVRTMSEPQLWTRMNRIENAKGRHAVAKMRLFASVCFLEGLFDLAHACSEALARLVAILGDDDDQSSSVERA